MKQIIIDDLEKNYKLKCYECSSINGGWLNQNWKIKTSRGIFLIKEFSTKRYSREKFTFIEQALQRQIMLYKKGISCPKIFTYNDETLHFLNDDTVYMMMEFCPGHLETANSITELQIQSLGDMCGKMHLAFSSLSVTPKDLENANHITLQSLWQHFQQQKELLTNDAPLIYKNALIVQEKILENLNPNFFDNLSLGFAHEDFTSDNILFNKDTVSAIIDFDRNCYSYQLHDIGRATLSFTLENDKLDMKKVDAFIMGYSKHIKLSRENIITALKISWCIESLWWINQEYFIKDNGKATHFRDEILWVANHWDELLLQ